MNKKYIVLLIIFLWLFFVTQFSENLESSELRFQEIPTDFVYDDCSMFPDGNYADCCKKHDDVYFFGGDWKSRLDADTELMTCVMEKWGLWYDILGPLMWIWVRVWWAPIWPTSYRWGFGRDRY